MKAIQPYWEGWIRRYSSPCIAATAVWPVWSGKDDAADTFAAVVKSPSQDHAVLASSGVCTSLRRLFASYWG